MLNHRLHAIDDVMNVAHESNIPALAFCKQLGKLYMVCVVKVKPSLVSQ